MRNGELNNVKMSLLKIENLEKQDMRKEENLINRMPYGEKKKCLDHSKARQIEN